MAKQSLSDVSFSQWFLIVGPSIAGLVVALFSRKEMPFPEPLYIAGGGLALSLLLVFLTVYGEDL